MKEIKPDDLEFKKNDPEADRASAEAHSVHAFMDNSQELMKNERTTAGPTSSMSITERLKLWRERRPQVVAEVEEETHLGGMIFILFLVLAFGIGVGGYALVGNHLPSATQASTSTPANEPTMDDITVSLVNSPREQILVDVSLSFRKTSLPRGDSRKIIFRSKDARGDERDATLPELFSATLQGTPPSALLSSLSGNFVYRIYSSSTLSGAITSETRSYPDSFSAMLDWEPQVAKDLIPLLSPWYERKKIASLAGRGFSDVRIGTHDARTLQDPDGTSLVAYAFLDKKMLVIAGGTDALRAALADLQAVAE